MEKICLLIPTLNRPEKFIKAITSFISRADKPEDLEIIVGIEIDDRNTIVAFNEIKRKYENLCWELMLFEGKNFLIEKYNLMYNIAQENIIFGIADDNYMTTQGWDTKIREVFQDSKDKLVCAVVNDGLHSDNLYRHFCIHRNWIDTVGYYMNNNFKHYYIDNLITATSRNIKRDCYMADVVIDHKHPVFGTAEVDTTYIKDYSHFESDKESYDKYASSIVTYETNVLTGKLIH